MQQYSSFNKKTFYQVDQTTDANNRRTTYLANQFVLSKDGRHFLGVKPDYRSGEKSQMVVMDGGDVDGGRQFAIGNTDNAEICFHLTNLAPFGIVVIMEHGSRTVANIHLQAGEYYCMDNYNITDKSHFGIKKQVKSDGTELTIKETRENNTTDAAANSFKFSVLAVKPKNKFAPSVNPLDGAIFNIADFITTVEPIEDHGLRRYGAVFGGPHGVYRSNDIYDTFGNDSEGEDGDMDVVALNADSASASNLLICDERENYSRPKYIAPPEGGRNFFDSNNDTIKRILDDVERDHQIGKDLMSRQAKPMAAHAPTRSLLDTAAHTTSFIGGRSAENLNSAFVEMYNNPVHLSVTVCINEALRISPWDSLSVNAQRAILDEYFEKSTAKSIKKIYDAESNCVVCLDDTPTQIFAVCGHSCTCQNCSMLVNPCPMCRCLISGRLPIASV